MLAVPFLNDAFGAPREVIPTISVKSMTAAGNVLYLGLDGQILAYNLANPAQPALAWRAPRAGDPPLPGPVLGFELRASTIYAAGLDAAGVPFRRTLTPPAALNPASVVDAAAYLSVSNGLMLVAGERLEVYDILNPQGLQLLGSYPSPRP